MEVSLLLAEVDKKYGSCKSYEDRIRVTCDRVGYPMDSCFSTKYLSPDKLIFRAMKLDSKDQTLEKSINLSPDFDSYIDGRRGRVEMDVAYPDKLPSVPFLNKDTDWNSLDRSQVLGITAGITFGASNFTLPLLIKGTRSPVWTKQKDFRSMGKKKLDGTTCYVLRRVSHPTVIWISAKDYSIRRVEMGAEIWDKAIHSVTSFVGKLSNPFWQPDTELSLKVDEATLETVCTFEHIKFNSLSTEDMNFV